MRSMNNETSTALLKYFFISLTCLQLTTVVRSRQCLFEESNYKLRLCIQTSHNSADDKGRIERDPVLTNQICQQPYS